MQLNDLDVLVVYDEVAEIDGIRAELDDLGQYVPVDVIYMHRDEEQELNFIAEQCALNPCVAWPNKWLQPTPEPRGGSGVG